MPTQKTANIDSATIVIICLTHTGENQWKPTVGFSSSIAIVAGNDIFGRGDHVGFRCNLTKINKRRNVTLGHAHQMGLFFETSALPGTAMDLIMRETIRAQQKHPREPTPSMAPDLRALDSE